jgi:transcriptional regulator with XRE-family HTH domain
MIEFGKTLKELRENKKMTQAELGTILQVSRGAVHGWENNKQEPNLEMLKKISIYFGVSIDYLLNLKDY